MSDSEEPEGYTYPPPPARWLIAEDVVLEIGGLPARFIVEDVENRSPHQKVVALVRRRPEI